MPGQFALFIIDLVFHRDEVAGPDARDDPDVDHSCDVVAEFPGATLALGIGDGLVEAEALAEGSEGVMGLGEGDREFGEGDGAVGWEFRQAARFDGAVHEARHLRDEIGGHVDSGGRRLMGGAGFGLRGDFGLEGGEAGG